MIDFEMQTGDMVTGESGSMVYTRGNIHTNTKVRKGGGMLGSLKTSVLGGVSFFVNEFVAKEDNCKLGLTGNVLGDIERIHIEEEHVVQSGSYVASIGDITLNTKWQGFSRGVFGSNLFMLKTKGYGDLFVDGWGGIRHEDLGRGEVMILDNYQLVAMQSSVKYDVKKHGNLKTTMFGGEALVIEITGPGKVYYQTKNLMEFARALSPFMRSKQ